MARLLTLAAALLMLAARPAPEGPEPMVSIWYRGQPEGTPRLQDLEAIRQLGFSGVTWPASSGSDAITRLASEVGLKVVMRDRAVPIALASTADVAAFVDVSPARLPDDALWPAVWRAVAHGARVISFDSGPAEFSALAGIGRPQPEWVGVAAAIGRQLSVNGGLFTQCRTGPTLTLERPAAGLDVVLLDAGRSWVVMATNVSGRRVRASVRLPASVPYAMWLSLLDGSTMAMLEQPDGPKWVFDLDGWGVRMYVIDKILK